MKTGSPEILYLFAFSQSGRNTANALLLDMLYFAYPGIPSVNICVPGAASSSRFSVPNTSNCSTMALSRSCSPITTATGPSSRPRRRLLLEPVEVVWKRLIRILSVLLYQLTHRVDIKLNRSEKKVFKLIVRIHVSQFF